MGRGLSPLQKSILECLPKFTADNPDAEIRKNSLSSAEILITLRLEHTEANRVAVSRSIGRLKKRGLVHETSRNRNNYSWSWAWVAVYFCPDESLLLRREAEKAKWEADAPKREARLAEIAENISAALAKFGS